MDAKPTDDDKFRSAAKQQADDELEVDDNAIVSQSDDGAWVAAWIWVSNQEAGL